MRISDWSSDVCSSDLQTQACGPCWAARLISASSWRASGAGSCSGKSLNTRWSELVVTHEHIANGVDETQHDGQRRKEIEDDQKDDAPASQRSEEPRVGKESVSKCRHRWTPNHKK